MKKFVSLLLSVLILMVSLPTFASTVLGDVVYTDIVTYINHEPIPSYNFKGITLIAAEDLREYGFNVFWNEYARTLTITRDPNNNDILPELTFRPLEKQLGKKRFSLTSTDVKVYTGNYRYSSFGGIDGKTLIKVDDLACIDNVSVAWVPEVKAVKVWVKDGLEMSVAPFPVRRIDENFTYRESCMGVSTQTHWMWISSPTCTFLSIAETVGENSSVCTNCFGTIKITDIIDADGKSRLKNILLESGRPSVIPYFYGFSDYYLSRSIIIDNDDLYPNTASSHAGLIKFTYSCFGNSINESFKVDCLPYE